MKRLIALTLLALFGIVAPNVSFNYVEPASISFNTANAQVPSQGAMVPNTAPQLPTGAVALKQIRIMRFGNSFVSREYSLAANAFSTVGLGVQLEALSQGQFILNVNNIQGNSGHNTTQMLADYTAQVVPNYANFDWLVMGDGYCINDTGASISAATTLANVQKNVSQALTAGKIILFGTCTPPNNASWSTIRQETSALSERMIVDWLRQQAGVIVYDFWNDWASQTAALGCTTACAATGIIDTSDGLNIHGTTLATSYVAQRALAAAQAYAPYITAIHNQWNVYNATNNTDGNLIGLLAVGAPLFQGTGGTCGTGCAGSVPANWSLGSFGGASHLTSTINAAASGYGSIQGNTVTISGGASFTGTCAATNLTTSAVTGYISTGDIVAGTGITGGTTIVSQTSGTTGGAGIYVVSASCSSSIAALTSALGAQWQGLFQTANISFPTGLIGVPIEVMVDITFVSSSSGWDTVQPTLQCNGSTSPVTAWGLEVDSVPIQWPLGKRYRARTPTPVSCPAGTTTANFQIFIKQDVGFSGTFTIDTPTFQAALSGGG